MGIFDGIEKIINEHGSAKILGERLLLAKDQNSAQEKRISELETQLKEAEAEKTTFCSQLQRWKTENEQLQKEIQMFHNNNLTFKYGVFWDREGNYYCPNCKKPTLQMAWAKHLNGQFHGLRCSCTSKPFVLTENGKPIQVEDAIKLMTTNQQAAS
jgi:hypothetical protein